MNDPAGDSHSRRHSLSDWLTLHELDPATCRRILEAMASAAPSGPAGDEGRAYQPIEPEVAWQRAVEALRDLLPGQQSLIDDTFEKSARILVDQAGKPRKSFTLDNGPGTYPTIVYNYRGAPSDSLVIAHEFAHALQIRASGGKFVVPLIREACAFLGESALLSYAQVRPNMPICGTLGRRPIEDILGCKGTAC
jgi:hypothetical protein